MAFAPFAPPKSLSTILLELYLNRSLPTNSAEEPFFLHSPRRSAGTRGLAGVAAVGGGESGGVGARLAQRHIAASFPNSHILYHLPALLSREITHDKRLG